MKTLLIVTALLMASIVNPVQMDYEPPTNKTEKPICTPATPNQEIYAMEIESDNIDLNTICSWQETIHEDITTLTLYTWDGNFYVLEMPTVYP